MGLLSLQKDKESLLKDRKYFAKFINDLRYDETSQRAIKNRVDEIDYQIKQTNILIERELSKSKHNKKNKNSKVPNKKEYSLAEKSQYYARRINNKYLTQKQRDYAKKKYKEINLLMHS